MTAAEGPRLRTRPHGFGAERVYSLEQQAVVRRIGRAEARWPLVGLRRMTFGLRKSPYAAPVRFIKLSFGRHVETIVGHGAAADFADFARALAAASALCNPAAHFEIERGRLGDALLLAAILLAAGAAALTASAAMAGFAPLGLDMAARMAFLLILVFAVTPWIGRLARRRLDPYALPPSLFL
jgi:hypothetical protein